MKVGRRFVVVKGLAEGRGGSGETLAAESHDFCRVAGAVRDLRGSHLISNGV